MCGIAGIYKFNSSVSLPELKKFTDSIQHRGPDGAGYELLHNNTLGLGHRRLSVLDLSNAAKQPMSYADGRYKMTFNGEIYNFIELRKELVSAGYEFKSDSDSEVILAAYDKWKGNCFLKFNGMWAIVIWDEKEKQLLLCRDRFGVKPLHYLFLPGKVFAFASETIAFKSLDGFERQFHEENLLRAMHAHNTIEASGETIFTNIRQVLPGHLMTLRSNGAPKQTQWWEISRHLPSVPSLFESQKEEFKSLFADACKIRLRSDVPIASALSGGLDSTSVYCMLPHVTNNSNNERINDNWRTAFSITFPGSANDESAYIKKVLDQTKGKGIIIEPNTQNLAGELTKSTVMSDLISGTPLNCLTPVYKEMHRHGIVVSMDGHGADEYLYGYQSSVIASLINAYVTGDLQYATTLELTLTEMSASGAADAIASTKKRAQNIQNLDKGLLPGVKRSLKKYLGSESNEFLFPEFKSNEFFTEKIISAKKTPQIFKASIAKNNSGEKHLLEEFHYTDLPYNLRDFDRGAMQHQVEIRMPFMDYRLVTYSMALPQKAKLNNGYTKYVLREAMKGIIPDDIRTRRLKIGLSAPVADWFNGPLSTFLVDTIHSHKLNNNGFLNAEKIKIEVRERCKIKSWDAGSASRIWPILNYLLLKDN